MYVCMCMCVYIYIYIIIIITLCYDSRLPYITLSIIVNYIVLLGRAASCSPAWPCSRSRHSWSATYFEDATANSILVTDTTATRGQTGTHLVL